MRADEPLDPKVWAAMSIEEKIARCEKVKAQYPIDHPQIPAIQKQIDGFKKDLATVRGSFSKKEQKI